ncbi:MAG: response regulator transcription factor [Prevotellaceae bacterium]|jgi:DNA-binding response OmpR family regulator|nr:response regulator transcription factor [Prevotellaceae bacterium]
MSVKPKILIVDDEQDIREILQFNLENEGYVVDTADSAESALQMLQPDHALVLLDVMMGGMSGFKMADTMRRQGRNAPIIFLTAKNTENDMLTGFSIGGDDYIRKPFSVKEVIARVRSVLKRAETPAVDTEKDKIVRENLVIDLMSKTVTLDGENIELTRTEFELLMLLVQNEERIFTREEILDRIWKDSIVLERTVDVHLARLRKKLGAFSENLHNRTGYGYVFRFGKKA